MSKTLFYLDEEYHKIYALEITRKESSIFSGVSSDKSFAESMGYPIRDIPLDAMDRSYLYLDYLAHYYDLENNTIFPIDDDAGINLMGSFFFPDKSALSFICMWERKIQKKDRYITMLLGTYLEQMLQF